MNLIFCMHVNIKLPYKMIVSTLVGMVSHAQSVQNNNFPKSLQYLKKELKNKFALFVQINIKVSTNWYCHVWLVWPGMSKVNKRRLCNIFALFQGRTEWWEWFFCILINIKILILSFLMGQARNAQSIISLQYLWDISRKKLGVNLSFLHAGKHQSFP